MRPAPEAASPAEIGWLVRDRADVPEGDAWLSPREVAVQARLRLAPRREAWRLGRWTAKQACGDRADEILAAADGAPEAWLRGAPAGLGVSISHCRGRGLAAVGPPEGRLGCDLEWIEPRSEAFVTDYLTAEEARWVRAATDRACAANLVWSAKESALKALRHGLRADTRRVVVRVGEPPPEAGRGAAWGTLGCVFDGTDRLSGWWRIADGFVLTVVSDRPATPVALDLE